MKLVRNAWLFSRHMDDIGLFIFARVIVGGTLVWATWEATCGSEVPPSLYRYHFILKSELVILYLMCDQFREYNTIGAH